MKVLETLKSTMVGVLTIVLMFSLMSQTDGDNRTKKEAKKLCKEIIREYKKGESFEELATKYSQDAYSKNKKGLMNKVPHGKLGEDVEKQVQSLEPGEISKPFITQFGYTVIKMIEKDKEAFTIGYILILFEE